MSNPLEEAFELWWSDHGSTMKRCIYDSAWDFHKRLSSRSWYKSAEHTTKALEQEMKLDKNVVDAAFNKWWHEEGSGIRPSKFQDIEEFAKHMTSKAWIKAAEHAVNEIDKGNI